MTKVIKITVGVLIQLLHQVGLLMKSPSVDKFLERGKCPLCMHPIELAVSLKGSSPKTMRPRLARPVDEELG